MPRRHQLPSFGLGATYAPEPERMIVAGIGSSRRTYFGNTPPAVLLRNARQAIASALETLRTSDSVRADEYAERDIESARMYLHDAEVQGALARELAIARSEIEGALREVGRWRQMHQRAPFAGLGAARKRGQSCAHAENYEALAVDVCADYPLGPPKLGMAVTDSRATDRIIRSIVNPDRMVQEFFGVLILNAKNEPIGFHIISLGTVNASLVDPAQVMRVVILVPSVAFIVVHNHPSGNPSPSPDDVALTARLKQGATYLGVRLLDHIVLGYGPGNYASFLDMGLMPA